jgi:hypothetical protein
VYVKRRWEALALLDTAATAAEMSATTRNIFRAFIYFLLARHFKRRGRSVSHA